MDKNLIIRSKIGGAVAIEMKTGDALPVHLATFSKGNLQAHMFFSALNAANATGLIDEVELDVSPEDAVWITRGLNMRSPHTSIESALADLIG